MMASYDAFLVKYRKILANATSLLRPNHLAVIVVGNVRSKTGALHHMLTDTTQAFKDCGCSLYNHAVLLTALGTAPMRAEKTMAAASKLVSTHQDVLIVTKGSGFNSSIARQIGVQALEESESQG